MEEKGYIGTDLIFEFDADDLPAACNHEHDEWICPNCGNKGKGDVKKCNKCGAKVNATKWVCDLCLDATKQETFKLIDEFLKADLGFTDKEISINFSGNRGYHIYVRKDALLDLDEAAHREIINYVQGSKLDPKFHGLYIEQRKGKPILHGPKPTDIGWSGRIARAVQAYVSVSSSQELARDFGISTQTAKKILQNREQLTQGIEQGNWDVIYFKGKRGPEVWIDIAKRFAVRIGAEIDAQASIDTRKIMRLPGSIHGGTGLVAMPIHNLDRFDPLKDPVVFGDEPIRIHVSRCPEIRLKDETFGPYTNQSVTVPKYAAIYFIAKKVAKLEQQNT